MSRSITRELGSFLAAIEFDDLSERAVHSIARHALDCLGVALAGAASEPGLMAADTVHVMDSTPHATVLASGDRASVAGAAWANGIAAHALDFDDTGFSHPTACILPAVLAVGEHRDDDGRMFVAAMMAGYEAFERIAAAGRHLEPELRARGLHPTALYGCAAAAAGVARLLECDGEQTATALGLALTSANGFNAQVGTWGKGVHAGHAAQTGVMAAHLAARGYWSSTDILEAEYGFFNAVFGHGRVDLSGILAHAGTKWAIEDPGLNIKPYPACGRALRAIDAALRIRATSIDDPDDIVGIVIETHPDYIHTLPYRAPLRGFHGKFSLDYCVATGLLDGRVDLDAFTDASATRPELRRLLECTEVRVQRDWGPERRRENPVRVHLADGTSFTETVNVARGSVGDPLTDEELAEKFADCARRAGRPRAQRAVPLLLALDTVPSIASLVRTLMAGDDV